VETRLRAPSEYHKRYVVALELVKDYPAEEFAAKFADVLDRVGLRLEPYKTAVVDPRMYPIGAPYAAPRVATDGISTWPPTDLVVWEE
jgi:hypothetical protein